MEKICIAAVGVIALISLCDAYPVSRRQYLPHRPGYVPVYIRNGDTPLEDINLDLAEAFHVIHSGRSAGRNNNIKARSDVENEKSDEVMVVEIVPPALSEDSESSKLSAVLDDVDISADDTVLDAKSKSGTPPKKVPSEKEQVKHNQEEAASKFIQKIPKSIDE